MSYNLIEKIDNLNHLLDLRELHAENNEITKMSGMENNKNMQVINLADNRIEVTSTICRKYKEFHI